MPTVVAGAQIQGVEDLKKKLAHITDGLRGEVLKKAVGSGAELFKDEMIRRAPYSVRRSDGSLQYGHLRDNIKVKVSKPTPTKAVAVVHTGDAYWGLFSEYGTERQPATPWIRPAFDTQGERAGQAVIGEVTDFLETHDG